MKQWINPELLVLGTEHTAVGVDGGECDNMLYETPYGNMYGSSGPPPDWDS